MNSKIIKYILKGMMLSFISFCLLSAAELIEENNNSNYQWNQFSSSGSGSSLGRIGTYGFPNDPLLDRAKGFLLKGKAQAAVTNFGRFIDWDYHPAGLWGNYTYLPAVAFVAGVPGQSYSSNYLWKNNEQNSLCPEFDECNCVVWCSDDAFADPNGINPKFSWFEYSDTNFVSVAFDSYNDRAVLGEKLISPSVAGEFDLYCNFTDINQFCIDDLNSRIMISLPNPTAASIDPNNANAYGDPVSKKAVGLVYPWAKRPRFIERREYDKYDYGEDAEEWTSDDDYMYYGATVTESWLTRITNSPNAEWQASTKAREKTHNSIVDESDLFSSIPYLDIETYPLLAHSEYRQTWPKEFNDEGDLVPVWPGWFAESFAPEETQCFPAKRFNDDCWKLTDRPISDNDVYMEFDDRWAHVGNMVSNGEYEQTGYPMGLRVLASAHSYGVEFAEDIMFVTLKVRNESGDDWCAFERDRSQVPIPVLDNNNEVICGDAMIMPDGTKLNGGKGFTYRDITMGFYMDADVVTANKFGNTGIHTNDDDFMKYFDCKNPDLDPDGCDVVNDDTLRVSIAMIYDYDFYNGTADVGIVATQLLDSPYATEPVDLNGDTYPDLYPGDKLKMTDWHWFDWYNRPGVVYREGDQGCCAGDQGTPQAQNKEEIMYKVLAGDTTNLSTDEKLWFFHTDTPLIDDPNDLNPHFDSLDGLSETVFFTEGSTGLDCVLEMSCGPFSLEVGEQVPFSFCIIWGQNEEDLIGNATFAQLMYNSHYQGYTAPDTPTLNYTFGEENRNPNWFKGQHHNVQLSWDNTSELSTDVVTGYADFEGYKIYRSSDGGETWGDPNYDLYDVNDSESWKPFFQYHLTKNEDITHCTFSNEYHGECAVNTPSYYVLNNCYEVCLQNYINDSCNSSPANLSDGTIDNECDYYTDCLNKNSNNSAKCHNLFDEKFDNCKNQDWMTCADSCDETTIAEYLPMSDVQRLNYTPIYSLIDCGDADLDNLPDVRGQNICGLDEHDLIKGEDALGDCEATEAIDEPYCFIDNGGIDMSTFLDSDIHDVYNLCSTNDDCADLPGSVCLKEKELGLKNHFIDTSVIDGFEYTYAVVGYDMGIASPIVTEFNEDLGILQQNLNPANPLGFAENSDGYKAIEGSKGRTVNDKNFVKLASGPSASDAISNNIKVVPNPYIVHSHEGYNETEWKKRIRFIHLPKLCLIHVFTVSGEKVATLNKTDVNDGAFEWDLRTINNQEIAPGLYVYAVENKSPGHGGEKFIGKFAVVR